MIQTHFPRPKNWQDFELLCLEVWKAEWNYPAAQRNGRSGQPQNGVDVSGKPASWHGVQCKGKETFPGDPIGRPELLEEIQKAEGFKPTLSHFILATIDDRDAKLQQDAREITDDRARTGRFSVQVVFWQDIEELLVRHPRVGRWYSETCGLAGAATSDPAPARHAVMRNELLETLRARGHDPAFFDVFTATEESVKWRQNQILASMEQSACHTAFPLGSSRPETVISGKDCVSSLEVIERIEQLQGCFGYWIGFRDGSLYLARALEEDFSNTPVLVLFWDKLAACVAEALLVCARYYTRMGLPKTARIHLRMAYHKLAGRILSGSTGATGIYLASIRTTASQAPDSDWETTFELREVEMNLPELVLEGVNELTAVFGKAEFSSAEIRRVIARIK